MGGEQLRRLVLVGGMSAAAIVLTLAGGVREAGAAFPGTNGKIVYVSDREAGTAEPAEIFAIAADGTDRVQLTTTPGVESNPAWSADGTKIAFERGGDLFVINADGSGETNVTSSPGSSELEPAWSPDGTMLVFRRVNELFTVGVDGTGELQLTDYPPFLNTADFQPAWSPDGTKIVFASTRDDQTLFRSDLYVMNADGTAETRLTNSAGQDDLAPNWSPDGTRIVWAHQPDPGPNQMDIFVMNADGTSPVNLTTSSNETDADPAWSPDGTSIVFRSLDFLWTVDPDGTGLAQLTSGALPTETSDREPDWGIVATSSETLTLGKSGTGDGTVTSAPAGISCGADCSQGYATGTSVTLTATAASGSTFSGWAGCDSVSGAQCTVAMTGDRGVTASFAATPASEPPPASEPGGADLRLTLSGSVTQVGENAVVGARVVNAGPSAATAVRLQGFLPAQTFAVTPSAGTCDLTASRLGCALGTLAPGDSVEVTIGLFSASAGRVAMALDVASGTPDPQPANNVAETTVEFVTVAPPATADLRVELAGPASGQAGAAVTFTGRVVNGGPSTVAGVSLRGLVANGLQLLTASTERGPCTVGIDVSCELGTLAPGETVAVATTARLPGRVPTSGDPALVVTVSGAVADPIPANDSARAAVETVGGSDCLVAGFRVCSELTLRMTADRGAAAVGQRISFRTDVGADWALSGPVPFTIVDELPVGADLISASTPAGSCTATASLVACALDPRTGQPLRVDVVVLVRDGGPVRNRAALVPFAGLDPSSRARAELVVGGCGALGTDGPDLLRGRFPGDVVCALDGADTVTMPGGGLVEAGGGDDLVSGDGVLRAYGGEGNDVLVGSDAGDVLVGGNGADRLEGRPGADRLEGGSGDDVLLPGSGFDVVTGGAGNDLIRILESTGPGVVMADGGAGQDELVGRSYAVLSGGDGDDTLVGLAGGVALTLLGADGDDRITGGTTLSGGVGDDSLTGDGRVQALLGGIGGDSIEGGAGADVIDAGAGSDVVDGDGPAVRGIAAPTGDDSILGGDGNDVLRGGLGRDTIDGEDGNDAIDGGGGADPLLRGGAGNDRVEGGSLADVLEGGAGNDWLEGGAASDLVSGGPGDDHVRGNDGIDRLDGGPGRDIILPGNQADVVDAIDGERDILQCTESPAVVDGPFLADEIDLSTYCRSLVYDFRLAGYNNYAYGYCVFSAARTNATLVYTDRRGATFGGEIVMGTSFNPFRTVTMNGSPGDLDRHRISWGSGADTSQTLIFDVKLVAHREGLTATHVNRLVISSSTHFDEGCTP